jgi:NADPH-dependent glutamate synthase beta subunit-like oxidoreductase
MPLASADDPTPEQLKKLQAARVKIMDRVMRKYLVEFVELARPVETIVEGDQLTGIRFQKSEVVDGRVRGLDGTEFNVRASMVISSIGSIPRPIEGVPTKGELYHYDDWDTGEVHGLPGVFGLGNVLTGKGNIRDSRANAIEIVAEVVAAYLGVGDGPADSHEGTSSEVDAVAKEAAAGRPMEVGAMKQLADRIGARHAAIGYSDYGSWIESHR